MMRSQRGRAAARGRILQVGDAHFALRGIGGDFRRMPWVGVVIARHLVG